MRKLKLLFVAFTMIVLEVSQIWAADAYATYLTTEKGWTKVTDLSSMTLSDYYFAIVSNDNTDLMVKLDNGVENSPNHSLWYKNAADPIKDNTYLWIIENNTTEGYVGYTFRNVDFSKRVLQTHDGQSWFCRTNWEQSATQWSSYACTLNDGAYTIQALANGGTNYLGLWTYSNGYKSGEELAGNKSGSEIGKFLFYAIPRTTAAALAIAAEGATQSSPYELGYFMFGRTSSDYTGATGIYEPGGWGDESNKIPEKYNDSEAPSTGDKVTKTITNAPNGYHKITVIANAAWISGRGNVGTTVPTTNDNSTVVTINGVSQNVPVRTDGSYNPDTLTFHTYVKDNNISFKITNNDAAAFWFVWGITDTFYGEAGEFTNGGTLSANQWYYYDAVGGNFTATAGSDLSKINYIAQSGSSTPSTLTSPTSLSATRYYFMSSVAQTLTLTNTDSAPFANGDYYLKVYNQDLYLSRAGNWGAEAATDIYGVAFTATRQTDGKYTLKSADVTAAYDSDRGLNYGGATGGSYTDSETLSNWIFKASTNGYYLMPSSSYYANTGTYSVLDRPYNYLTATTTEGNAIEWQLINASTYATNLTNRLNAQATAVATAAGLSSTTVSGLETDISSWIQTDCSSYINNPSLTANTTGWTALTYAYWGNSTASCDNNACEIYDRVGGLKQTVSGLPEGLYKVTVDACYRLGSENDSKAAKTKIDVTAFFSANTASQTNVKQIKSWYDYDGSRPTDRSSFAAVSSNYTNTLYVYVGNDEDLTLTIGTFGGIGYTWMPFMNWTLTRYDARPTTAQKEALANAIDEAEANLGFEDEEYAPYNNIDAITVLAAAKAIDPETATGADVVAATTALTGASWNANDGEVNAIRWNKSEDYSSEGETKVPTGGFIGSDANSRISHNPVTNAGLTGLDQSMVLMVISNTNATYGETEGYTLPLKANTAYEFKFKYAGWGECGTPTITILKGNETIKSTSLTTPAKTGHDNTDAWEAASITFRTTEAGDYKLRFSTSGGRNAFGDLELKKATSVSVEVSTAGFATYVNDDCDLDFSSSDIKAYKVKVSTKGVATLTKVNQVPVSTPVLLYKAGGETENIPVIASADAVSDNDLVAGTGDAVATTDGDYTNMILNNVSGIGFYFANNQTVATNRAYLHILTTYAPDAAASRMVMVFADETTGISATLNDRSAEGRLQGKKVEMINDKFIYNLNGQRVEKPAKGLYIVNGKKVVRK